MALSILVTGSKGQLGSELKRCLDSMQAEIGAIPEAYSGALVDYVDYGEFDVTDVQAVESWFDAHAYDLVINCAAATNVDGCEADEEGAFKVNAIGPENLARASALQGVKFVQVSTDYVFAGDEPTARAEEDETGPVSAYGRTKLAGENLSLTANPKTFVVRTAWLYGYVGGNFVKTMRCLGQTRESVTVVDDQFGNPTSANDLAYEILKIALTDGYGVYHATNEGTCSWAQFAVAVMEGLHLDCEVIPVTSEEYKALNPASANRPHYSSLENSRLSQTIGNEMRSWREALTTYLAHLSELGEAMTV